MTVYDATSNHRDGTAAHIAWTQSCIGVLGNAAVFDGTSASIAVPGLPDGQGHATYNQLTIEAWVKVNTFASQEGFGCLYNHDGWSAGSVHMHVNPASTWEFSVNGNEPADLYLGDPATFKTGAWYHLAAVYDADTKSLAQYINGQMVTNSTYNGSVPIELGPAHLGAWNGTARYFTGAIDEFAIYPAALPADRIKAHYDAAGISAPELTITFTDGNLVLRWSPEGGTLESTPSLLAPTWTPVGTGSPVTVITIGPQRFYRVQR